MWAIAIRKDGRNEYIPAGNDGFQKLHNTTPRGWKMETSVIRFFAYEVFVVSDFTQEMCEMDRDSLITYIRRNHVLKLK